MYKIYATKSCSYCTAAQNLLTQQGFDYDVKYIDSNDAALQEYKELLPGVTMVPQIFLNEGDGFWTHIGGYNELMSQVIRR